MSNIDKIEVLENSGMIDAMYQNISDFKQSNFNGYSDFYQWQRWIRR